MKISLALVFFAVACGIFGQLALKLGMSEVGRVELGMLSEPLTLVLRVFSNPLIVGGLGLYALGTAAWLTVLSRVPLSFAYPLLGLNYAIIPVMAWIFLGENLSSARWLGIATIVTGVILVLRS